MISPSPSHIIDAMSGCNYRNDCAWFVLHMDECAYGQLLLTYGPRGGYNRTAVIRARESVPLLGSHLLHRHLYALQLLFSSLFNLIGIDPGT